MIRRCMFHLVHIAFVLVAVEAAIRSGVVVKAIGYVLWVASPRCIAFDRSDPVAASELLRARIARIRAMTPPK